MTLKELKQSLDAEFAGHRFSLEPTLCDYRDNITWTAHMNDNCEIDLGSLEDALAWMRVMAGRGAYPASGDAIEVSQ
jgi:hypothetical protein